MQLSSKKSLKNNSDCKSLSVIVRKFRVTQIKFRNIYSFFKNYFTAKPELLSKKFEFKKFQLSKFLCNNISFNNITNYIINVYMIRLSSGVPGWPLHFQYAKWPIWYFNVILAHVVSRQVLFHHHHFLLYYNSPSHVTIINNYELIPLHFIFKITILIKKWQKIFLIN